MTTYEEAKRCPRCEEPGQVIGQTHGPRGSQIHQIQCRNSRCKWFNTAYVVQVNADGTIPDPVENRRKDFPALPNRNQEQVDQAMQRLLDQTLSGKGETR